MSSTGSLLRHYLELALIEAGAGGRLRDPDVRTELATLEEGLDRQDEALRLTRKMAITLERLEEHLESMAQRLASALERLDRL